MKPTFNFLETIIVSFLMIAGVAFLGGAIVYWLWPIAIPAVFPGLVAKGVLAGELAFWPSVALNWLCILLLKGVNTGSSK